MSEANQKILVVDDALIARMSIKQSLKEIGYENVHLAVSGNSAWDAIEKALSDNDPFDMIICDWMMPDGDGIELVNRVRGDSRTEDLPFIMVTSEAELDNMVMAISSGINVYIVKPITVEALRERIPPLLHRQAS